MVERKLQADEGEIFGWSLSDQWHMLGSVYYFLLPLFNLIESDKESSPIIDAKGESKGNLSYGCRFEIYDTD